MGDNVQILIHDITSSNLKFENNLVVMRIVPNKNISKCVYGNLIGRFIGNSIDFINLNNYIFTPFIDHGLFLGYFKFKYINNSWRAFFPTTLKFKVQNKSENNISAGRGSGTCFFVDSLESPNIIISSDTTYKIINESVEYKNTNIYNLKKIYGKYYHYKYTGKEFVYFYDNMVEELINTIETKKILMSNLEKIRTIINELYINLYPMKKLIFYC